MHLSASLPVQQCPLEYLKYINTMTTNKHMYTKIDLHNCRRTVLSSKYMVLDKKSIPIVAYLNV